MNIIFKLDLSDETWNKIKQEYDDLIKQVKEI